MSHPQQGPGYGEENSGEGQAPYGLPGQGQPGYDPHYGMPSQPGYDPYHAQWPQQGGYSPYPPGAYGHRAGSEDPTMALLAHLSGILLGFLGPLIFYLIKKDESPYVRHHSAEALNFQITMFIAAVVSAVLALVFIGILMLIIVSILIIVFAILAAMAANRGEWYRYPISIRLVT